MIFNELLPYDKIVEQYNGRKQTALCTMSLDTNIPIEDFEEEGEEENE